MFYSYSCSAEFLAIQHLGAKFINGETEYLHGLRLIRAKKLEYYCVHCELGRLER